jgi:preprotein translocase subunit SecE
MPPRTSFFYPKEAPRDVAKTSPGEFIRQVRAEATKVVWPTRAETVRTTVMVLIMTALLALFFFATDSLFSTIVRFLLSLLGTA